MALDEIKIWAADGAGGAIPLDLAQRMDSERLLEDTIVNNPDLLIEGLTLVGRQTPTEGGPLDLLGVDEDGRLVVFELKRGTLSREAVAQVIDYASYLQAMPDQELANFISQRSGAHGITKIDDFPEWYEAKSQGQELSALKPVRMVLVGMGVDDTTTRMVRFLANGVDIALLTFHGYTYEGKTLLARQVQVEAVPEPERTPQRRQRLGRRQRREMLEQHIDQHTAEQPETRDLWNAVLEMFHENLQSPLERPSGGGGDPTKHRLRLRMPGRGRSLASIQLGPFGPHPGLVSAIFRSNAVKLCLDQFIRLRRDVPSYLTWPRNSHERETGALEIEFPFNSLAEWEEHKDRLAAVTRSVYEAYYTSGDDGDSDAAEDEE